MLVKLSKQILEFMLHDDGDKKSKTPSERLYNFHSDLNRIAKKLHSDPESIRAAVRDLEKDGYLKPVEDQNGNVVRFSLDHKGLHWKEYRRKEIMRYLEEKWIDFFALLVATVALVVSCLNH